mmetsp:Transcript_3098/g.8402  ORF Transcript_3098/g.8402 Transcript_3098/m.8402 type:complete len:692 (+) Transcript_3098:343-2418(+)|eukprot:CAMPEP_0197177318 /NCGR_PEP_ID=MMETSP1423-20130617/2963_1 /TAXON_ID=476441 /ORGANISM="Pseudo-nitzschia heimii, Strain UNC1101" /LENGTH=691 /DNA_ID=CAMNT_0042626845 /DNA_START=262 /DNA_END=2337 /DNA_ORIENTATION=+
MLARWFDRSGIGQLLAPDPNADPVSENDEPHSAVWQFLAPDDNFGPPRAPPPEVFPPQPRSKVLETPRGTPRTPLASVTTDDDDSNDGGDDLNARVLSACRDTSMFMRSPMPKRKVHDKFLRICASTKDLPPKMMVKMRSMVEANSYRNAHLLRVRATRMGESAPDGYTAFMVAAYANHLAAAKLLLDLAEGYKTATGDATTYADLHLDRDMFGMTALHIAGERGHVEMIQFLLPLYKFPSPAAAVAEATAPTTNHVPLIDLGGQTAFGRAVTSPIPKAKKNQRTLEKSLFSRNDLSIFGETKPIESRMGSIDALGLDYGTSDMPGLRGYMEDALSVTTWVREGGGNGGTMTLFAVCDGHGDHGKVSDFLASNAKPILDECMTEQEPRNLVPSSEYWGDVWKSTCLRLDQRLREEHFSAGGSTGIFALVTEREIVVANVGDCRCVLARRQAVNPASPGSEPPEAPPEESEEPQVGERDVPVATTPTTAIAATTPAVIVTALSEDHKPDLPGEAERIRKAGFDVRSVECREEDGTTTTIHRVAKNATDDLAVSRAFGDFDYKANTTLTDAEQAVVPLPGVTVHTRSADDRYLVLACDGIWDVIENEAAIDLVADETERRAKACPETLLPDAADAFLQECLGRGSRDNLSAILVRLDASGAAASGAAAAAATASPAMPAPKTLDFGSPSTNNN